MKFRRILEVSSAQTLYRSYGHIFSIFASKNEAVCCEFGRILEVLCLQGLQKKFWAHFHDLYVQK